MTVGKKSFEILWSNKKNILLFDNKKIKIFYF